jgi:FkbM family methyltransferase
MMGRILEMIRVNALAARNLGFLNALLLKYQLIQARIFRTREAYALRSRDAAFPVWCRPGTTDSRVFYQIFILREYSCLDDLAGVDLIVDCGANVGYSSAYFLSRHPEARVIAVEPDPENAKMLERNLRPFGDRAKVVRAAVWSHAAGLVIDESAGGGEWAVQVRECREGEAATIQATTVGAILAESGEAVISLLKMDVEGAEAVVFTGNYREWLDRTENLVIELHGEENRRVFATVMDGLPFTMFRHGELTVCRRRAIAKTAVG